MGEYGESDYPPNSRSAILSDSDWYNEMRENSLRRSNIEMAAYYSDQISILPDECIELAPEIITARKALLPKLLRDDAPVTNRTVACMLQTTEDREYRGRNHERGYKPVSPVFIHAEMAALVNMLESDEASGSISRIIMAGTGQEKAKEIAPCRSCYTTLLQYMATHVELVLLQPNYFRNAMVLGGDAIERAYEPKEPLQIGGGETKQQTAKELEAKTDLNQNDAFFIAHLREFMIENEVELYLTGSASGRGGISQEIHKLERKSYTDIDLVAVTDKYPDARKLVDDLNKGSATHEPRVVRCRKPTVLRSLKGKGFGPEGTTLDLIVAPTLEEGILDPSYYRNNWYVKIAP